MIEQKVYHKDQIDDFKILLQSYNPEKIFLVCDKSSFKISGAERFISSLFLIKDITIFNDFESNPQLEDLKTGVKLFSEYEFDLIVAIGGGSVLDMAKLISFFAHQESSIEDIVLQKSKIKAKKTKLIAIPTTAGTGAEATHFAVLYLGKSKYSVANSLILPDYVYLSAEFSYSAGPYLTACTGADAFCQAIEAVWSVNANEEAEKYAIKAIELCWHNLPKAVNENNSDSKNKMQEAAFLAGKAINLTKTTAPHALSYAFTSYYNIPHGHAVALTLPFFMEYNYKLSDKDCSDPRGANSVKSRIRKIVDVLKLDESDLMESIIDFFESIGLKMQIPTLIENFDLQVIINNVNFERLNNNPRVVIKDVISDFLIVKQK